MGHQPLDCGSLWRKVIGNAKRASGAIFRFTVPLPHGRLVCGRSSADNTSGLRVMSCRCYPMKMNVEKNRGCHWDDDESMRFAVQNLF